MKRKGYRLLPLVLLTLALLLAGCRGGQTPAPQPETEQPVPETGGDETGEAPASNQEIETIRIGYIPVGGYAPFFVAIENGYFREQGLEVELESFRTGAEMVAPLSLGQLDVGAGEAGTALYNAIHKELNLRVVLTMSQQSEGHGNLPLVVRKDLFDAGEVTEPAELEGRKIAVNALRGVSEYLVAKALEQGGLTVDDVELVIIPFPEMLQALLNGAVDAALIQHPLAASAIRPGENGEPPAGVVLIEGNKVTDTPQNSVIYFGQRLLDPQNRDISVRVVTALVKAFRDLQGDAWRSNDQIVNAIIKYTNVPEPAVRNGIASFYDPDGMVNLASMEDQQRYLLERGYAEFSETIPMDRVIDMSFLDEAIELLGTYQP